MKKRKMPNEHKLILVCTRLEINSSIQREIRKLLNNSINWNKIIEISHHHQILPFLYYNLNKLNLQDIIPKDIFAAMQNCYCANLYRNLVFEKEIFLILELTNRGGISIIPFKGFTLIQTLYHNPGLRIMADVDILIKDNDFQKVNTILIQLGYQEAAKEISEKHHQKYQYETVFSKKLSSKLSLIIEIHCAFAPARPYNINLPGLWERTYEKIINGQKLPLLSQEDTFLSLVLHFRRHTRRLTLKFIVDIAELLNINGDKLDWLYIKESAKNNHIITPVYLSLYLAKDLLNATVSQEILNEFRPNIIKNIFIRLTINKYNFFHLQNWQGIFLRLLLFDNPIDFLLYLWRVSFLERFINRWYFKKDKKSIAKRIPINAKETIKK